MGSLACCVKGADHLRYRDRYDRCAQADPVRATGLLRSACEGNEPFACWELAVDVNLRSESEAGAIFRRARGLLSRACDENDAQACAELAGHLRDGVGVASDPRLAALLTKKARVLRSEECRKGDPAACEELASSDLMNRTEIVGAVATLERLCASGRVSACAAASRGRGLTRPRSVVSKLTALLQRGCALLNSESCNELAFRAMEARDTNQEFEWRKQSCRSGSAVACHTVADYLLRTAGEEKAVEWRSKGCALGVPHATCPPKPGTCAPFVWPPSVSVGTSEGRVHR